MDAEEQSQLNADQLTYEYLTDPERAPIWQDLGAFADAVTKVEGSLNVIHTLAQVQNGQTTGITTNKNRLRLSVEARTVRAAKVTSAYAKTSGNDGLAALAKARDSVRKLKAVKDGALVDFVQPFLDAVTAARAADPTGAANSGLKTGAADILIAPLASALSAYAATQSPRAAINQRSQATANLQAELRRLGSLFRDDLDKLIAQFEEPQPDFVSGYFTARKIINPGGKKKTSKKNTGDGSQSGTGGAK